MSSLEQSILLPSGELALGKCILFLLDAVCWGANWMGVTPSQGYQGIRLYTRVKTDNEEKTQDGCYSITGLPTAVCSRYPFVLTS